MGQPVVHFEIGCRNNAAAQIFYGKLFDWKMTPYGPAAMVATGSAAGIQGHINSLGHEPHNYVTVYVQVDDLPTYLDKANQLGGKTLVPATEVPGMGHFAWFADPEGNIIGLWKPVAPPAPPDQTAGQRAAKTRKLRSAGRKAALTKKRRAAGKKAARTKKWAKV